MKRLDFLLYGIWLAQNGASMSDAYWAKFAAGDIRVRIHADLTS